jgi:hypothetical protein
MLRIPHCLDNRLTDGGKAVSLTHRPIFNPGRLLVLVSLRGRIDPRAIARLEGLGQLNNPISSPEIKPATCRVPHCAASISTYHTKCVYFVELI